MALDFGAGCIGGTYTLLWFTLLVISYTELLQKKNLYNIFFNE